MYTHTSGFLIPRIEEGSYSQIAWNWTKQKIHCLGNESDDILSNNLSHRPSLLHINWLYNFTSQKIFSYLTLVHWKNFWSKMHEKQKIRKISTSWSSPPIQLMVQWNDDYWITCIESHRISLKTGAGRWGAESHESLNSKIHPILWI